MATDVQSKLKEARSSCKLDLGQNRVSNELPEELFSLQNLQILSLYHNHLTAIPKHLWNLTSLIEINLSRNLLETLSTGISCLKYLKVLNLGSNKFSEFPVSFFSVLKRIH